VRLAALAAWAFSALLSPSPTRACTVCDVGGSALTTIGSDRPIEGRLRLAGGLQYRTESSGAGQSRLDLEEERLDLWAAYAPIDRLFVTLRAPILHRAVDYANLAREGAVGPGDLELGVRALVYRDRAWAPRHSVSVMYTTLFPTAMRVREDGVLAPHERQLGTGSVGFIGEALYTASFEPVTIFASLRGEVYAALDGERPGPAVSFGVGGQVDLISELALKLGTSGRLAGTTADGGEADPNSGGFIGYLTPAVLVMPADDLVLSVEAQLPVLDALRGAHDEGPAFRAGVTYDL
jgi:hypothetical protein